MRAAENGEEIDNHSPTAKVLGAIAGFCERSLDACRLTEDFFNAVPCISMSEIDPVAAAAAGHDIFVDKSTEQLLAHLAALRALDRNG